MMPRPYRAIAWVALAILVMSLTIWFVYFGESRLSG